MTNTTATESAFKSSLTRERIEHAYSMAVKARDNRNHSFAAIGMRAAKARDPKLLVALEAMAETTGKMQEEQIGRLMRSPDSTFAESKGTTEHQLCREAYRMVDQGTPIENFAWIYGAAAYMAGYVI
jgi:hypothetical protein